MAWQRVTRRWWQQHRDRYTLYTSRFVHLELREAPIEKGAQALQLIESIPVLETPPGIDRVIDRYFREKLMPAGAGGDAAHLALASFYSVEFLLTWNCRHLANANKHRHIAVVNKKLGLHVPAIVTPLTLLGEDTL